MNETIKGLDKLLQKYGSLEAAAEHGVKKAIGQGTKIAQAGAVLMCPVNDEELRQSIKTRVMVEEDRVIGTVYTNKKYAAYVELGTGPRGQVDHAGISPEITPAYSQSPWWIHESQIDYFIEADYPCPPIPDVPFTEKDAAIGKIISGLVPDGACIQLGIGGIPNAVAEGLKEKNDLGVHTELITSGMMELVKMGVITNKRKQLNRGQMVATMALGSPELYAFIDHNPGVALYDGAWVNDPYVIAQNDNQISINTSLEVDLTGQCASESIGSRQFSGTGGQSDTAVGAQMSKGGRSIIALYSTAMVKDKATGERHEVSKITAQLQRGAAVSLSRNDADLIVTEYGVADLRGANINERVRSLIEIAHPKFREQLWEDALRAGIIGKR